MQALEFFLHRMNCLGQPGDFRRDLVGADRVMSNFEGGMRNELRAADGDAPVTPIPCRTKLIDAGRI